MQSVFRGLLLILLSFQLSAFGQAQPAGGAGGGEGELFEETKDDILVVTFAGLGGAVLGLSTLSFVEEPKKHTRNIVTGAALGIIIGVGLVAFNQANKSAEMFYEEQNQQGGQQGSVTSDFDTSRRLAWHFEQAPRLDNPELPQVGWSFQY